MKRQDCILFLALLLSACQPNRTTEIYKKIDSLDRKASSYYYPEREVLVDSSDSDNQTFKIINIYCADSLYNLLYISHETIDTLANRVHSIAFFAEDSIFKMEYEKMDLNRNTQIGTSTLYFWRYTIIRLGNQFDIKEVEIAKTNIQELFDHYISHRPRRYFEK